MNYSVVLQSCLKVILQEIFHVYNISGFKKGKQWNKNMKKLIKYINELAFHQTILIKILK